jgi:hypothetical protein
VTASTAIALAGSDSDPKRYCFVARQPIFTADEKVFGYELLVLDGIEDYFREQDSDAASRITLDSSMQMVYIRFARAAVLSSTAAATSY